MVPSSITTTMENTNNNTKINNNLFHKLKNKWNLWAHLPQKL